MDFTDQKENFFAGFCPGTASKEETGFERACTTLRTGLAGAIELAQPFMDSSASAPICTKNSEAHPPVHEWRSDGFSPLGGVTKSVKEIALPKP